LLVAIVEIGRATIRRGRVAPIVDGARGHAAHGDRGGTPRRAEIRAPGRDDGPVGVGGLPLRSVGVAGGGAGDEIEERDVGSGPRGRGEREEQDEREPSDHWIGAPPASTTVPVIVVEAPVRKGAKTSKPAVSWLLTP